MKIQKPKVKKNRRKSLYLFCSFLIVALFASIFLFDTGNPTTYSPSLPVATGTPQEILADDPLPPINTGTPEDLLPVSLPVVFVNAIRSVNVRSCASMQCPPINWLMKNTGIEISACETGWAFVPVYDGFIFGEFLSPNPCID